MSHRFGSHNCMAQDSVFKLPVLLKRQLIRRRKLSVRRLWSNRGSMRSKFPATVSCHRLLAAELRSLLKARAGLCGVYFDGFAHSEALNLPAAMARVRQRRRDAILFFDRPQESLFLFHSGVIWICHRSEPSAPASVKEVRRLRAEAAGKQGGQA